MDSFPFGLFMPIRGHDGMHFIRQRFQGSPRENSNKKEDFSGV